MQPTTEEVLEDILRNLRIEGTSPYEITLQAPWGVEMPNKPGIIACYLFRLGRCWVTVGANEVGWVEAGDVLLILGGNPYTIRSAPDVPVNPFPKPRRAGESCNWIQNRAIHMGGEGEFCRAVLVSQMTDRTQTNPVLLATPGWLHLEKVIDDEESPLARSLELLETELRYCEAGLGAVIDRLGEVVLAQVLRGFLNGRCQEEGVFTGWLRGAADPRIGSALRQMHREPEQSWTVAELATVSAMSRTSFALRFSDLVGMPPLAYLRRLRIDRASQLLRENNDSVAAVAERVGYSSEAAFCRAFKGEVGLTPREWRIAGGG